MGIVEDPFFPTIPTLAEYFTTSGWTGDSGGASWYQLNTASNALPRWPMVHVSNDGLLLWLHRVLKSFLWALVQTNYSRHERLNVVKWMTLVCEWYDEWVCAVGPALL